MQVHGENKYEMTMSHPRGKDRLMEGFKIGDRRVHARELVNDELVVSFLNLPFYIEDKDILEKLKCWGVSAASPIKRRMWPGTNVADGTRFLKVKFNNQVQSLPYSAKFNTALGIEYFRVIHDKQVRVCRMCIQPGHILRECPEFQCHKCGVQGHFARECSKGKERCGLCHNQIEKCRCNRSEEEEEKSEEEEDESGEGSESGSSEGRGTEDMESVEEGGMDEMVSKTGTGEVQQDGGKDKEGKGAEVKAKGDAGMQRGERTRRETTAGKETAEGKRDGGEEMDRKKREERRRGNDVEVDAGMQSGERARKVMTAEVRTTEKERDGAEHAGPETKEERKRGNDESGERRKVPCGASPKETGEDSHASQTVGSDTDMELVEKITQIRKRQNTERHMRGNKKSKSKNKK